MKKIPRAGPGFLFKNRKKYNSAEFAKVVVEKYGRVTKLGPFGNIYLNADADCAEEIFLKNKTNFSKDVSFYYVLMTLFGRGLLTSEGARWRAKRDWFQPLFTPKHLLQYAQTTIETVHEFFDRWDSFNGEPFDFANEALMLSLSISVKIFFHETWSFEDLADMIRHFNVQHYCAVNAGVPGVTSRSQQEKMLKTANQFIDDKARELLARHREDTQENLATRLFDFRDPVSGEPYPEQDLIDEVKTFLGTGHDTVGTVMGWAWHSLLTHPETYQSLRQEVDAVLRGRDISVADLEDLPYTLQVFNETARLYPPIWVLPRKPLEDVEINSYHFKKGSVILTMPYAMQRLNDYWKDPDEFKPERFSRVNGDDYPKHSFLPFGAGPRICIARVFAEQQARLILAMIAKHYDCELMPDSIDMPCVSLITLKPARPINLRMKRR